MKKNPFLTVVANTNFRNLWLGQITSQIALNMLSFVLAIRVYEQTGSNSAVSLLLLMFGIPAVIFGIIAGGIVDYFDKRDVLIFCNIARVVLFAVFYFFYDHLFVLYLLSVLFSVITQAFIPAEAPSIPELVDNKLLLTANSLFTISFYLSTFIGFIIAGPLLRILSMPDVYLFMMFVMTLATIFVYKLPQLGRKSQQIQLTLIDIHKTINEGIKYIQKNSRVKQSLVLMTFAQALIMTLSVLAPGFADRVLSIDLTESSYLVMGPVAIGLVLGALFVGAKGTKIAKKLIIYLGIMATAVILMLVSVQSGIFSYLPVTLMFLFLLGFFNSFITVPSSTILQQYSKGNMRGRVYGVMTALTGGISILPVIFSGILADVLGTGMSLFVIGGLIFAAGIYKYKESKVWIARDFGNNFH